MHSRNTAIPLPMDAIFDILSNERRRHILRYLDAADEAVTIGELAEMLAEGESDNGGYDHRHRKRTYLSLRQSHLPRMADVGIVEYESRGNRVRLAPAFDHVEPYLYDRSDTFVRWNHIYLAIGLVGVGVAGSGYLWSSMVGSIPEGIWVGLLAGICTFLIFAYIIYSVEWFRA